MNTRTVAGIAVFVLAVSMGFNVLASLGIRDAREDVAAARAVATVRGIEADSAVAVAQREVRVARDQLGASRRVDTLIITRIRQLPPVPSACEQFTRARDSIIMQCQANLARRDSVIVHMEAAAVNLFRADTARREVVDSLTSAIALVLAPPSLWQRLTALLGALAPDPGVGGFAGICANGEPCAGVGVTLGWRF